MLVAGQNTAAPEIRIPVLQRGWHAISFGIRSYDVEEDVTRLQVRLESDSTFSLIRHTPAQPNRVDEYFWKAADLRGDAIVLRQLRLQLDPSDPNSPANGGNGIWLAWVKLEPLNAAQSTEIEQDRASGRHRTLFAHNDAWSYTFTYRPTSEAEIRRELEPFRDTDFARIYWEAGMGDRMFYPTRRGLTPVDDWTDDPYRTGDRLAEETWRAWRDQHIDPFRTALEYAHAIGLEFHATYRVAGFHFPVPEDVWNQSGFYDRHPQFRGVNREGQPTPRLSYAWPEVRQEALGFLTEIAAYPVDGIALAYNRRPPLLEYEPPVVDSFRAKYGLDPRKLDDRDPRWLAHRAETLTGFMRDVRRTLAAAARAQGRTIQIHLTAIVMGSEQENLYDGIDLAAWVREGLIDTLVPYTSVQGLHSDADSWTDPKSAEFFLRVTKNSGVKLALNLMPRVMPPEEYCRRVQALYAAGVENLFFWDCNARNDFGPSWSTIRRLGHREELADWERRGSPPLPRPGQKLYRLGDWDLRYVTPG